MYLIYVDHPLVVITEHHKGISSVHSDCILGHKNRRNVVNLSKLMYIQMANTKNVIMHLELLKMLLLKWQSKYTSYFRRI